MNKEKKIIYICIAALLVVCGSFAGGASLFLNHPLKNVPKEFLYIDNDDTADSVFVKMEKQLHTQSLNGLRLLAKWRNYSQSVKTGAYRFSPKENTWQIFTRLRNGNQTPVRLTINGVRTMDRLARQVSRQIMADSCSISQMLADSTYLASIGYNATTLPALFIPNTYEVYWNMSPQDFMKRMKREHERFWTSQRKEQARKIGLSEIEVATLASIVDEETAYKKEMPMVAGLYINRLRRGIPLQADPTVKFSMKNFGLRRILFKHLQTESPYNTYKYAGLPPGPIRIPTIVALESVLYYTAHDYIYMCAKEDFSGSHNFARTLSEHNNNARRYQRALNHRKIY